MAREDQPREHAKSLKEANERSHEESPKTWVWGNNQCVWSMSIHGATPTTILEGVECESQTYRSHSCEGAGSHMNDYFHRLSVLCDLHQQPSRRTWVYPMWMKREAFTQFQKFKSLLNTFAFRSGSIAHKWKDNEYFVLFWAFLAISQNILILASHVPDEKTENSAKYEK